MEMIRAALWILLGRWFFNVISLISFAVIVASISVPDYGSWAIASTALIFSDIFFQDAGENSIVRQKGDDRDVAWSAFWVVLLYGLGIAATVSLAAPLVGFAYGNEQISDLLLASAGVIVLQAAASVARGVLLRNRRSRAFAITLSAGNLFGAVTGIGTVLAGVGIWALLFQQLAVHVTVLALAWGQVRVGWPQSGSSRTRQEIARFLRFGFANSLLNVGVNRLDVIFASLLFGEIGAGYFNLAKRIIQIVQDLVGSSFDKALIAFKSRFSDPSEAANRVFNQAVTAQSLITVPTFVGLALVAALLVPLVFGENWFEAGPLVALMAVGGIFRSIVTLERAEQVVSGDVQRLLAVRLIEGIIALALLIPFAPLGLGTLAAIFSIRAAIGYLLVVLSHAGAAGVQSHFIRVARLQGPFWLSSLIMAGGVSLLNSGLAEFSLELRFILLFLAGVVLYGAAIALLRRTWLSALSGS